MSGLISIRPPKKRPDAISRKLNAFLDANGGEYQLIFDGQQGAWWRLIHGPCLAAVKAVPHSKKWRQELIRAVEEHVCDD